MEGSPVAVLKKAFEVANSRAELATLAVVIGLIVEFAVLLIFAKEISRTEKWLLIFANILVAGGVGGEYVFGSRATIAAVQLQQISDEKVAALTTATAQLQKDNLSLQVELEKLKAPRVLRQNLVAQGVRILTDFAGTPYDFSINPGHELIDLAGQIIGMLDLAKWTHVAYPNAGTIIVNLDGKPARLLPDFAGLGVEIDKSKVAEWSNAASALTLILRTAVPDTKGNVATDGGAPPNAVHIYVGTKQ